MIVCHIASVRGNPQAINKQMINVGPINNRAAKHAGKVTGYSVITWSTKDFVFASIACV